MKTILTLRRLTILFSVLFFIVTCYAQEEQKNPNVELPDFVITGREDISVRRVDKIPPDFVSSVSEEFLKPVFAPEQLEVSEISNPVEGNFKLLDSIDYRRGYIFTQAGRYTLPYGEVGYMFPFTGGKLSGNIKGYNQLEYEDNSDRSMISGALDFNYAIPTDAGVLPGTNFLIHGNHLNEKYKFFGSITPTKERTLNIGNAKIGLQNLFLREFIFDISAGGDFTYMDNENYNEAVFVTDGFGRLKLGDIRIGVKGGYQSQTLTTDIYSDSKADYFFFRPTVSFEILNSIMAEAGFTFSGSEGKDLNNIYASIGFVLAKNLTIIGEYAPVGEFINSGKLVKNNYYFNSQLFSSVFLKKQNYFRGMIKYEYEQYFQIDGGIEYYKAEDLPYYVDPDTSGFFSAGLIDATNYSIFLDMLFHTGPSGMLYGSAEYNSIKNSGDRQIPYYPELFASLSYGYNFSEEFRGDATLKYISKRYSDIQNLTELKGFFDMAMKLTYAFHKQIEVTFEVQNILSANKYYWADYKNKPVDALIGVNFFFD